jgi:hypothetical protein
MAGRFRRFFILVAVSNNLLHMSCRIDVPLASQLSTRVRPGNLFFWFETVGDAS